MIRKLCGLIACVLFLGSGVAYAGGKTIVVAHDSTWPPMEFVDDNRNIVGYSVDYIDAVAKEAGIVIEHKTVAWDGIFAGLAGGKYDVISSSVTITEDRKRIVDFTEPYYEVRQALIVPKATEAASLEDMAGKKVGSQIGTTGFMAVKKQKNITSTSYDEIGLAMAALATGRIDGVVCDDATAKNYILANPEYAKTMKVAAILPADVPEYYGFAVAKGNKELVDLLNKGIAAVKEKGIDKELVKKWIQ